MKKASVREFERRLAAERTRLHRTVARTDEELATLESHQAGESDDMTVTARTILVRLEGHERHELDEIRDAQARLRTGVFGTCEQCGTPVPLARLRAVPTARHCLTCEAARSGNGRRTMQRA
jgi:DnaK suppressor protein